MAAQMVSSKAGAAMRANPNGKVTSPNTAAVNKVATPSHVCGASKSHKGRWKGMDAGMDVSDDQQDIARGRGMVDTLFQGFAGSSGTQNAIMSSQEYLSTAQRNFNNIEDGFYISPAFLDKMSIHIAKNFMDLPKIKVPLILGIWGGKGQGKTFQCMLAFKKLGITPIVMSAGELESGNAGEPAKLIRQRYREASDIIKKGKMCALFINDLDAGAGRFGMTTQYTVNNQMVNATLMNIADNPTNVQLPGVYKTETIPRVPIICTGNDFSTLYAPLIRDGRMEKYYWNPTREDRIGVCMGIFQDDGVTRAEVEALVDNFPGQSIDFFGALRARVYDDSVRKFVEEIGHENLTKRLVNSKEGKVQFEKPKMSVDVLMTYGKAVVQEQDNVRRVQLADAYLAGAELAGSDGSSVPETYVGASEKFKNNLNNASSGSAGWRAPVADTPRPPPRAPTPAPTPSAGSWRSTPSSSPAPAPTPAPTPAASAPAGSGLLSAGDLSAFKADDLGELCRKKGVSGGKSATRESLTEALVKAGVSLNDLSRGQLVDLGTKLGKAGLSRDLAAARRELSGLVGKGGSAAASWKSTPAPTSSSAPRAKQEVPSSWRRSSDSSSSSSSSGSRFASYAGRSSSPAPAGAGGASSGSKLAAGDLVGLRIDDLRDLVKVTGTQLPREPTKQGLIDALVANGVTLAHCTRGMLVDLSAKLGAPMAKDADTMRRNLASLVGKGGAPAPTPSSSWRSAPGAPAAPAAAAAPASNRFSNYSAGASEKAPWRRSGSYTASSGGAASGSGLSAADLGSLRIDDLRDIAKKAGVELSRDVTKDGLISTLAAKGVSLTALPRAALVDLCGRKGVPTARDAETMRKNLASKIGGGAAAPAAAASGSSSSWRSAPAATPAAGSTGGRFASYGGSSSDNGSSSGWRSGGSDSSSSSGGSDAIFEADLSSFKIDDLTTLARKVGIEVRNATKDSLVKQLASKATVADLSKGNLVDILSKVGGSISGSVEDLRNRVRGAASQRQSARATAGSRW